MTNDLSRSQPAPVPTPAPELRRFLTTDATAATSGGGRARKTTVCIRIFVPRSSGPTKGARIIV